MLSASFLEQFSPLDNRELDRLLQKEIQKDRKKLVVLDDDPTGTQTVHDVSVYTDWSLDSVRQGFEEPDKLFFILTNSRSFTAEQTVKAHQEIAAAVAEAARETGKSYLILSRSDSTLRGHYPLETQILKESMDKNGVPTDGEILCPFFKEGGRFTIDNIHYVKQGSMLIPAAETEFSRDPTFGYSNSSLPEYVEEKTHGAYKASGVTCISLKDLRGMNLDKIQSQLESVSEFGKICVNAVDYCDIKVFAIALYRAMAGGKTFLFRTASSLVRVLGGIKDVPLLSRKDIAPLSTRCGGVVVIGSHTQKTNAQLRELLKLDNLVPIEFHSDLVLGSDEVWEAEITRCVAEEENAILAGKTAVCFTNRRALAISCDSPEDALRRSVKISDGLQSLIGRLQTTPSFVLAKGGITSSDVGTKALKVRRANVMGQICPGVPVWRTGEESRFPFIPYVIFPGNVGETSTLREAVEIFLS